MRGKRGRPQLEEKYSQRGRPQLEEEYKDRRKRGRLQLGEYRDRVKRGSRPQVKAYKIKREE